jgi:large subunit ribosomal protein L23
MNQERLLQVLKGPHVSDKGYRMADESNHFAFKVATNATKREIKRAVEQLFDVQVTDVRTVNVKGKARRFGRTQGRTSDWKKAYVKLKPGQDISFGDAE